MPRSSAGSAARPSGGLTTTNAARPASPAHRTVAVCTGAVHLPCDRQGYPAVFCGVETVPWNLIRFTPAEGGGAGDFPIPPSFVALAMEVPMSAPSTSLTSDTFEHAFPGSRKAHVEGPRGIRVPMREIVLSGGEPPLRVYDPSGPQGVDVRQGLPALRQPWLLERDVHRVARARLDRPHSRVARAPGLSRAAAPSPSSTMRDVVRSPPRWNSSPSARGCRPTSCAARWRAAAPSSLPTSTIPNSSR